MDLLKAFIEYVPDEIYEEFTCLDIHNLASTHGDLGDAIAEKSRQRYRRQRLISEQQHNATPTQTERATARTCVDHARAALLDETDVLEDFAKAVMDFKERIRTYTTMFNKQGPSHELIEELKTTFTKHGQWYQVGLSKYAWITLNIELMDVLVTYEYTKGKIKAKITDAYISFNRKPMCSSWKKSLALGVAILESVEIPYVFDTASLLYDCPSVYKCLRHKCLPEYNEEH